jgi:ApaG protein
LTSKSYTTSGITVSVISNFDGDIKEGNTIKYVFSYQISIFNSLDIDVKLLSRRWNIFDSIGQHHTVEGEGVIGQQPVIIPNHTFTYSSWCPLLSPYGYMEGHYTMLNLDTNENFEIIIPRFELSANWLRN